MVLIISLSFDCLFIVIGDFISPLAMTFPFFDNWFAEYYAGAITSLWLDHVSICIRVSKLHLLHYFRLFWTFLCVCCDHLVKVRLFIHSSSSFENHYILLFSQGLLAVSYTHLTLPTTPYV